MFNIYLKRAAESFGVTNTREIYERAIEILPDIAARLVLAISAKLPTYVHAKTGKCV